MRLEDNQLIGINLLSIESEQLFKLTQNYVMEIASLRKENAHLKELLTATVPLISKEIKIEVTKEQATCEIQLRMLYEKAQHRELTLEETKRLEILIKSLYLIKDKATDIGITGAEGFSVESLTRLAENVDSPSDL